MAGRQETTREIYKELEQDTTCPNNNNLEQYKEWTGVCERGLLEKRGEAP